MLVESNVMTKSLPASAAGEQGSDASHQSAPTPDSVGSLNSLSGPPSGAGREGRYTKGAAASSSLSSCLSSTSSSTGDYSADSSLASNIPSEFVQDENKGLEPVESGLKQLSLSGLDHCDNHNGEQLETIGSCCCVADDMAGGNRKAEKYIVDIPYSFLFGIYQSLDADKGWEALAAEAGYTFDKIKLLELEGMRNQGSPARSLLWEFGSRNTTVRQLYGRLKNLNRYREMKILEDYVFSPSANSSSFDSSGLQGLPEVCVDMSKSLKGHKTTSMSNSRNTTTSINSSNNTDNIQNSFNFNKPVDCSEMNNSMNYQQKDKHYTGKQMPLTTTNSPSSSAALAVNMNDICRNNASSEEVPMMKPNNPGCRTIPSSQNVAIVQSMLKQMPDGTPGSGSLSSHALPQLQLASCASSPSSFPSPESAFPSSLSSLPGLESTFDVQMAFMGSACFCYAEILQATNGFSEQNKIGHGAFGTVYYGVLRKNKCAVKKMSEVNGQETVVERSTQIKRELTSLLKFRHENIVTLYGYALDGESLCLVYQFMPNGSLEDRILCKKNTAPLIWSQRLNILLGACQGLNFLHTMGEQPLIHGDIKSANILLDKHMEAKIGDLGQAQQANGREAGSTATRLTHITRAQATTKLYGTRAYQPREVQTGCRPSTKSDIFAMGVVLLEVFSGEQAYDERREGEQFLGDYFLSVKGECGDEACLTKIDRRGGDCSREVALAILNIAFACTSALKRHRPDSAQLLQKMTETENLYREKTGLQHMVGISLPGSEQSCVMSHTSAAVASDANMTQAAPPHHNHATYHSSPSLSDKNFSLNMNKDIPTEKHYAMHLSHEKPDNCQTSHSSLQSNHSAIDYFQKGGKPLPPAFRLQQAYDCQTEAEKRRISRLSQCPDSTSQPGASGEGEVLPQADPAKLAVLEQFDRLNLPGNSEEKESNAFRSDPKKLAALKNFDEQAYFSQACLPSEDQAIREDCNLSCDPQKLAYLRQFDNASAETSHVRHQTERADTQVLPSDPCKLAMLRQFDCEKETYTPASQQEPSSSSGSPARTDIPSDNMFPVSQLDYVVISQREAMDICNSMAQQQPQCVSQPFNHPQGESVDPQVYSNDISEMDEIDAARGTGSSCREEAVGTSSASDETLLLRRNRLFDLYSKAQLDESDDDDDDFEEADCDYRKDMAEEHRPEENTNTTDGSGSDQCSHPLQEQVAALTVVNGHYHPVPSEQDESVLNYFKQREQRYRKTFSKVQTSRC